MKKIIIFAMIILIIILCPPNALALSFGPLSSQIDLGDGLVFFMTTLEDEILGYPKSGLYRNGELIYALHTDDAGLWFLSQVYFSDDAMTLLYVPGAWAEGAWGAIRFYEQGIAAHEHRIFDLLRGGEDALRLSDCVDWPVTYWTVQRYYNREDNILRFTTVEYTQITFDLSTGLIISIEEREEPAETRTRNSNEIIVFIIFGIICIIAIAFIIKIKRLIVSIIKPSDMTGNTE